jgi:subtilisin-like proprotein convertase family protein
MISHRSRPRRASAFALAAFAVFALTAVRAPGQSGCNVSTFNAGDAPRAIPDPGTVESTLDVPAANDPIAAVVAHVSVIHPFDSDLKMEIVSPQGTSVILGEAVGMWGHDFTNTVFADVGSSSIVSQLPPFTGTFQPAEPLGTFAGLSRGGTWKLRVTDLRARYAGQLQSWSLEITTCPNAQPTRKGVGAPALPPLPTGVPAGHIPIEGTLITVTTNADEDDAFPVTVAHLLANPGPDGTISLREAIEATNHDPGIYTIRFAPALAGKSIDVSDGFGLLPLTGGGLLIDGDIDGDGQPDVTITDRSTNSGTCGFTILSSSNRIHALSLQVFPCGIQLSTPFALNQPPPSHVTLAQNIVSGAAIVSKSVSNAIAEGIFLRPNYGHPECNDSPCDTHNTWADIRFVGNRIESDRNAIEVFVTGTNGDTVERLTVAGNDIRIGAPFSTPGRFAVNLTAGWPRPGGSDNRLSDTLVAYNRIETEGTAYSINIGSGTGCGSNNVAEDLGIIANRVHSSALPSIPEAARGFQFAITDGCAPDPHIHDVVRRVRIVGNAFSGQDDAGVMANEPCCGNNPGSTLTDVLIADNLIQGIVPPNELNPWGIVVGGRLSVSNVTIDSNTVEQQTTDPQTYHAADLAGGGIALVGGLGSPGSESLIHNVLITNNRVDTDLAGITLLGGGPSDQDAPTDNTQGHSISGVLLRGNVIEGVPVLATRWDPTIKGISLIGGLGRTPPATPTWWRETTRCSVNQVTVDNNLVAGIVDDVSVLANFGDGASGNSAAPVIRARTVEIAKTGSGSGSVTSTPGGIDCGSSCSALFALGSTATLIARPASGSVFAGWSGDCSGAGPCPLSMNGDHVVTATFALCSSCGSRRRAVRH